MSVAVKAFFFLILIAAMAVSGAWAMDEAAAKALFTDAGKAYHAARYDDAVRLNEAVLSGGYSSPVVYYNLGNAYFKAGHLGKAILHYSRALRQAPRDSDLRANLSFVRSLVENFTPWQRNSIFARPGQVLSGRELQWTAFMGMALAGAFFIGGLYMGLRRKRLVLCTGVLAAVAIYFVGAAIFHALNMAGAGVCVERSEARFEPNATATTYFKVPEGAEIRILRDKDGWAKIERSDGRMGWVPSGSVEKI